MIAAAKAYGYTVVTLEAPSGGLSTKTPNKNAKIPDVAKTLGGKTSSLFEMMRTRNSTIKTTIKERLVSTQTLVLQSKNPCILQGLDIHQR